MIEVKQATDGAGKWFLVETLGSEGNRYESVVGSLYGYRTQAEAQTIADTMNAPSHLDETETVDTSRLRPGDVVRTHGLRVRVGEIRTYGHDHGVTDGEHRTVYASTGEILNPEFVDSDRGRALFGGILPRGSREWTIQGNEWARWEREVR